MRLLLISLQTNSYLTGIKYIASNVIANSHDARILFMPGYMEERLSPNIKNFIRDYSPDLIGIGLMSIEFYPSRNITELLKETFDIPVIWGGVHAIMSPEECIKYADYVCSGEGEQTVVQLLEHLRDHGKNMIPDIPNLWVNDNGNVISEKKREEIADLNSLPHQEYLPAYFYGYHKKRVVNFSASQDLFRKYAHYGGTCHMILTSRGCPFNCSYCGNSYLMDAYGNRVRERSVENCINELKEVRKYPHIIYINIEDDWFLFHSREWIEEFCREYKRHIKLPFMIRVFPSKLDREQLLMLRDAGLSWVLMGIQSGSDRVNYEVFNRKVPFTRVLEATGVIAETKAAPYYEMIVDNPYETEDDQIKTVNAILKIGRPFVLSLAHLTYMPGTQIREMALKDGIKEVDSYLTRFLMNIDYTYFNKLLYITPYVPRAIVSFLNIPKKERSAIHSKLVNILFFIVKRTMEPGVYFFITTRGLKYNILLTIKSVLYIWRSAVSIVLSNFLDAQDVKYDEKLKLFRKIKPALFEK
jgi:radical SAM superfamily enzyme YgiQ (UPF0313 family)